MIQKYTQMQTRQRKLYLYMTMNTHHVYTHNLQNYSIANETENYLIWLVPLDSKAYPFTYHFRASETEKCLKISTTQ